MTSPQWKRLTLIAAALALAGHGSSYAQSPEQPIWAKHATALDLSCSPKSKIIYSPDHLSSVQVLCHKIGVDDATYSLQVKTSSGQSSVTPLDDGAHELLWSPNSHAFFIDGGLSAYSGFFVDVYELSSGAIHKVNITGNAQRDMVATYPPCKAYNRDKATCGRIASDPAFNMSGLVWLRGSSAIAVFAEVPCSSSYGGIMCQVLGYELNVPDGRILKRITAVQISHEWRNYTNWEVRVPDPAVYGAGNVTF